MFSKMALEFARTFEFKIGYSATSRTQLGQNFVKKGPKGVKNHGALFSGVEDNTYFDGCKDDSIESF
jgi:hypothetical protein